jgi:hypothetical protein
MPPPPRKGKNEKYQPISLGGKKYEKGEEKNKGNAREKRKEDKRYRKLKLEG